MEPASTPEPNADDSRKDPDAKPSIRAEGQIATESSAIHGTRVAPAAGDEPAGQKKKKKKKEGLGTSRGIETMFRTSYRVHMDLSSIADTKANIMISINGLIISILIASLSSKIDSNTYLLIPTSVMLIGCLVSTIIAVLSARPRVNSQYVSLEDVRQNRANILFFGHFSQMEESEFQTGMTELLQNPTVLYQNMIRDIYGLGRVLEKKFRLLRLAYTTFMIALTCGILSFISVYAWVVYSTPLELPI